MIVLLDLLIVLVFIGPQLMVRAALFAARRCKYELALSLARFCFFPHELSCRLKAILLCDSGEYAAARKLMRPRAFDAENQFLLHRPELLIYTLANLREEKYSEAEPVLTAAVESSRKVGPYHLYMVELLLTEGREINRAAELLNTLRGGWYVNDSLIRKHCVACQISALGAWLLAMTGQREEAEEQLEILLQNLPPRAEREVAQIHILIGETQFALGNIVAANDAFLRAASLDSNGSNALLARRRLDQLNSRAVGQSGAA